MAGWKHVLVSNKPRFKSPLVPAPFLCPWQRESSTSQALWPSERNQWGLVWGGLSIMPGTEVF